MENEDEIADEDLPLSIRKKKMKLAKTPTKIQTRRQTRTKPKAKMKVKIKAKTVAKKPANKEPRKRKWKKRKYPAEKLFGCQECGKKFYFNSKLEHHMLTHTGEKPYACKVCGKAFNSQYSLKTHGFIHTNEKPFKCSFCEYACRDSSTLRKHQHRHMGIEKIYRCKMCEATYKHKYKLKAHVAEVHLELDLRKHPCAQCHKLFKTPKNAALHERLVHKREKEGRCPICDKYLANINNLSLHMLCHVDVKPYLCTAPECEMKFKTSSDLKKHSLVHWRPQQLLSCELCGQFFAGPARLHNHNKRMHTRTKCVECHYCGQRFYSKRYLINHIGRKHTKKKKRYICDLCGFKTTNKPSIVMHIKYGHESEKDRECHICHTIYRRNVYLKNHYKRTHNIIYKTKVKPTPPLDIKEELIDIDLPIDLFEIEKHEPFGDIDPESNLTQEQRPEDEIRHIIESKGIKNVPEGAFEELYIDSVIKLPFHKQEHTPTNKDDASIDKKAHEIAKKSVAKLLAEGRRREAVAALEKARQEYNERMRNAVNGIVKNKTPKIKFFKNIIKAKEDKNESNEAKNDSNEIITLQDHNIPNDTSDEHEISRDNESSPKEKHDDQTQSEAENETHNDISTVAVNINEDDEQASHNDTSMKDDDDEFTDEDTGEEYTNNNVRKTCKVNFNSHQCNICFKLFESKEKLVDHCKDHFDVCTDISLKKCPLCGYVCKHITKHLKLKHDINVKIPYARINDKKDNTESSRYYFETNNPVVKKIEVIPSIRNLNNLAALKINKDHREAKNKTISKTKLVKKGKEWIVETEKLKFDKNVIIPDIDRDTVTQGDLKFSDSDKYLDKLKKLYHVAKKEGKKILFPCQHCDKICRNLCALKLHKRKHEVNPKPFRPKVWKHKMKQSDIDRNKKMAETKQIVETENRTAKPQPIKNKHKCDPELKEFYEKNIRGGDIEFWQFLKIFNKMSRENIKDFKDLEGRYEYGIGHEGKTQDIEEDGNIVSKDTSEVIDKNIEKESDATKDVFPSTSDAKKSSKRLKCRNVKQNKMKSKTKMFRRVIRISKEDYAKRNLIKQKLRDKIAQVENYNKDQYIGCCYELLT